MAVNLGLQVYLSGRSDFGELSDICGPGLAPQYRKCGACRQYILAVAGPTAWLIAELGGAVMHDGTIEAGPLHVWPPDSG